MNWDEWIKAMELRDKTNVIFLLLLPQPGDGENQHNTQNKKKIEWIIQIYSIKIQQYIYFFFSSFVSACIINFMVNKLIELFNVWRRLEEKSFEAIGI
jgi:hypothetical protein